MTEACIHGWVQPHGGREGLDCLGALEDRHGDDLVIQLRRVLEAIRENADPEDLTIEASNAVVYVIEMTDGKLTVTWEAAR